MQTVFVSKLKPFLDAVAAEMELYVPSQSGEHYIFNRYEPANEKVEFNSIRACTPVKEFLFPLRETAASLPGSFKPENVRPFAVFGLKDCDLRSIEILDKVFLEDEFEDPFYVARRRQMFTISSDCANPGKTCFCNLFEGKGFATGGFDLNLSAIKDGFIVEAGSQKGQDFLRKNSQLFADVPDALLAERDENRAATEKQLRENNADLSFEVPVSDIVAGSDESEVYDAEAESCIECQACTRVCPTCHCFYLYDTKQRDYFAKMKMWDSCMRFSYATVAGGENPYKYLGDRLKHRLMHKFVYFLERYGINMCVGCGRCVDADAGGIDLREILKKLSSEIRQKT